MSDESHEQAEHGETAVRETRHLDLDRFNAFSDGVFAIAITLLVLEIPVPGEAADLLPALREQWAEFLGYYISFAFIGGIWITHSRVTTFMKRGDAVAYAMNLLLLLFVGLLPFATSLMVTHLSGPGVKTAVLLYGLDVLFASLALSLLMLYVAREPALLVDDVADWMLERAARQRWISIGVNLFALAMALVAPLVAVGLYLLETTILLVLPMVGLRRHRHRAKAE
ncbi:MAG TPA: TMEM175 family protein [Thermoleophilia bacterium]|nr:TMEM175 family protein [Thermoleophilia bacterium]